MSNTEKAEVSGTGSPERQSAAITRERVLHECSIIAQGGTSLYPTEAEFAEEVISVIERLQGALEQIAEHPVVSESKLADDLCDWHCTVTMVAEAKDALNGD